MSDELRDKVQALLEEITGVPEIEPDEEGDWVMEVPAGLLIVHVVDDDPAHVQLRAQVTEPVPASTKLVSDIIALNAEALFSRVCLYEDSQVVVEADILGATLDRALLELTMDVLAGTMDAIAEEHLGNWQNAG